MRKGVQILFDRDSKEYTEYVGISASGTSPSSPQWQIKEIIEDVDGEPISIKYAGGTDEFNQIWNNRTTLIYS